MMVAMTEDRQGPARTRVPLEPDPEAYDEPRNARARAKGLDAPYIAGGDDPQPNVGQAEERRYWRLLVLMVVVIVASGFILGTLIAIAGPAGGR